MDCTLKIRFVKCQNLGGKNTTTVGHPVPQDCPYICPKPVQTLVPEILKLATNLIYLFMAIKIK